METFVVPGVGAVVSANGKGLTNFSLSVYGTGAVPTLWIVSLEISLDGVKWTTILKHTTTIGDGVILSSAGNAPALFYRMNCTDLTLGSASNIKAVVVAKGA